METEKLLSVAENAARGAGEMLRGRKTQMLSSIGHDIKLDADKAAHDLLLEKLGPTGISVLSEEGEHDFSNDPLWVIDPLDGSFNFSRGVPLCAVSICLVTGGEPVVGVVYDFNREEMFSGMVGGGAWLNGESISVSNIREKAEAVLMTGFPSYTDYSTEALEKYISAVQSFKKVRLLGSAALSLAYVASGRADAYYEKDIKIWDVAAGLALVKAAGGKYTNIKTDTEGTCTTHASNMYFSEDESADQA